MPDLQEQVTSSSWIRRWCFARPQNPSAPQLSTRRQTQTIAINSSSSSLSTFIKTGDNLPEGWMLSKRKRRSAGDIQELEQHLELKHGIIQKSSEIRRPVSANPAVRIPEEWETHLSRGNAMEGLGNVRARACATIEAVSRRWTAMVTYIRDKWRAISTLLDRKDLRSSTTPASTSPQLHANGGMCSALLTTGRNFGISLVGFLQDTGSTFSGFAAWTWFIMRWPSCTFVAGWMLLQAMAMTYTFTSSTFLSGFCQYQLPLVRNWVCGSWDEMQNYSYPSISASNLLQPFDNILRSNGNFMSYELPYFLQGSQTRVRLFRVSLPESEFSPSDQEFFRTRFGEFVDQSHQTIDSAHRFHAHMVGTINRHVSDTKYVVRKLDENGHLSPEAAPISGILEQIIAWLNSHYLIYLPVGVEPFRETTLQIHREQAVNMMEEHIRSMVERLSVDIEYVTTLKGSLGQLEQISAAIGTRISQCKRENTISDHQRGNKRLLWIKEMAVGQGLESYQFNQRSEWIGIMQPVFQPATAFLGEAANQLGRASLACQMLLERLAYEGRAVKYGHDVHGWVREQANELATGIEDTETQLKAFKLGQFRYHEQVYKRGDPGYKASTDDHDTD